VLWEDSQPLVGLLRASGSWDREARRGHWDVWVRRRSL
jgi:hypothetical protein